MAKELAIQMPGIKVMEQSAATPQGYAKFCGSTAIDRGAEAGTKKLNLKRNSLYRSSSEVAYFHSPFYPANFRTIEFISAA